MTSGMHSYLSDISVLNFAKRDRRYLACASLTSDATLDAERENGHLTRHCILDVKMVTGHEKDANSIEFQNLC